MTNKLGFSVSIALVACAVGLTPACSGKTVSETNGGDGGSSSGSSSGGGATSACDDYFQAAFSGTCQGIALPPPSEVARIQSRFDTLCNDALALPGVGLSSADLEACVAAVKSHGCSVLDESNGPCAFETGSLGAGTACVTDAQCTSGACSAGIPLADGGTASACGTCSAPVPVGEPCDNGQCGAGEACSSNANGDATCFAITSVGAGATCNGDTTGCNQGLICNSSAVCATPGGAGAACEEDQECAAPLVCPSVNGTATCQPVGAVGAPCVSASECQTGLTCASNSTHQCATATWVAAGQPCSDTILCLVGSCPENGSNTATCPTVIPDGQACSEEDQTSTCDWFANCTGGTCVLGYPSCP
jgi:hypothetical protein